jgi:hypothetical protein
MKKIWNDAVAVGNATACAIAYQTREYVLCLEKSVSRASEVWIIECVSASWSSSDAPFMTLIRGRTSRADSDAARS